MRQVFGVAALLLPLSVAVAPTAAEAQILGAAQCLNLFFGSGIGGETNRLFALEVHGVLDVNPRPAPALSRPGWWMRPGGEIRAFVGIPGNGMEISGYLGWLMSDPTRQGTLRPGLGLSYNLPTGAGGAIYGLVTGGLWMNMDGQGDAWGPSTGLETRLALGGRFVVTPILSMVTEINLTTVATGAGEFEPFVGIRLGWAISPPDPKQEEAMRQRRERRERKMRERPLTPPPPPPPTP